MFFFFLVILVASKDTWFGHSGMTGLGAERTRLGDHGRWRDLLHGLLDRGLLLGLLGRLLLLGGGLLRLLGLGSRFLRLLGFLRGLLLLLGRWCYR